MRAPGEVLLISCYDMGRQPLALASPLGFLRAAGFPASSLDVAAEGFDAERARRARFVGISVPMHTAMRLGMLVGERVRALNPAAHLCYYGLYASLNAGTLLSRVADSVIGGECEGPLLDLVRFLEEGTGLRDAGAPGLPGVTGRATSGFGSGVPGRRMSGVVPGVTGRATSGKEEVARLVEARSSSDPYLRRLSFQPPDRSSLPPLDRYAKLDWEGELRIVGSVETSRGCRHHCRHCPIPPVYGGRFFIVPKEIVLGDIRELVARGARHVTFSDPDFLNGPGHSLAVARCLHAEHPELTFDITTKVEHILRHRRLFPELASLGCLFAISAIECTSDEALARLHKGHTRADILTAAGILREAGIALRPSLLPFTPWTTLEDYADMLQLIERLDLIDHVDAVYYAIRLLLPPGSLLLGDPSLAPLLGPLDEESFSFPWRHPDPRMDSLHADVSRVVERAAAMDEDPRLTFEKVKAFVHTRHLDPADTARHARESSSSPQATPSLLSAPLDALTLATHTPTGGRPSAPLRKRPPRMTESWFC